MRPSRQLVVVGCAALAAGVVVWLAAERSRCRTIEAGFWFEEVHHASRTFGGAIMPEELQTIQSIARSVVNDAFDGLNITFSERRDATHLVRVVQELRDIRFNRPVLISGQSRVMAGLGGHGAVSFSWHASGAAAFATPTIDRSLMIEAIGRGIGRAAVHEFAHVLLPNVPIHDSTDIGSYEYRSAARREQYFGDMRWDLAGPLLQERLGHCTANVSSPEPRA